VSLCFFSDKDCGQDSYAWQGGSECQIMVLVHANRCTEVTQSWGIMEIGTSDRNQIIENYCNGNLIGGLQTNGPNTIVRDNEK